jgi:hypothetical protein
MKKIILTLAIVIGTISAFAREAEVTKQVLNAFEKEFADAKDVSWTVSKDHYRACFIYNARYVFAFYTPDGELLAMSRYISSTDLPLNLLSSLKKNYSEYWITDLFEVAKSEGTQYVITVENADTKLILKAGEGGWNVHERIRKS